MLIAVLSVFILALAAPWLHQIGGKRTGWLVALLPLGLAIYFGGHIKLIASGSVLPETYAWVPSLGINLSFYLDGLSLLFALLINGIGGLVLIYTGGYMAGHPHLGRFYAFLLMFMASMLGLVLADNLITLFVFWELTSFSSYLLIGFNHERETARAAALQALLVTGIGGLALLAGFLLLGQAGGSLELSTLLRQGETIRSHALYLPILLLILAGAFTKSAQFPFHFWLPNAMEAPTPASAYLHSSTMVKAGVYLIARLSPVLGGTTAWQSIVTAVGATTMLVGAYLALQQTYLKRLLAYSTVSTLGASILLLGVGIPLAIKAAMVLLFAHALYKAPLFLVAGALDHETGERDVEKLGGLRRAMPITAAAGVLGALSMAGIPPLFGFISKELLYEATWESPYFESLLTGVAVLASMFLVAIAILVGIKPFFGKEIHTPKHPHEAPINMWLGPILLAAAGLVVGVVPFLAAKSLLSPAIGAVLGKPTTVKLALWHGLNLALAFDAIAIAGGICVYAGRNGLRRAMSRLEVISRWGPGRWYKLGLDGLNGVARGQTRILQSGYLRFYLLMTIVTTVGLVGYTFVNLGGFAERILFLRAPEGWSDIRFYEAGLAVLILAAAVAAVRSKSRLAAIACLGVVGYGVALIFVLFGAPDLAMTQFVIETLTVILFVLVFYHLPRFTELSGKPARLRDLLVALTAGGLITGLVLVATNTQFYAPISAYFAEHSLTQAHGRNIVNVILVDFRGIDTLGEITVLAIAGTGVYALLKLRLSKSENEETRK